VRKPEPQNRNQNHVDPSRSAPRQGAETIAKPAASQPHPQQRTPAAHDQKMPPGAVQHEQQAPGAKAQGQRPQDRGESKQPNKGREQQGHKNEEERGQERNK
jgi:hypothetical protein